MEQIKVGDYVRTKRGLIGKIININTFREPCMKYGIEASYLDDTWFIGDDDIELVKEKPIDLIEVGDYVNGEQIIDIRNNDNINNEKLLYYYIPSDYGEDCFRSKDIKSIVTKEQFERMEYKIDENN